MGNLQQYIKRYESGPQERCQLFEETADDIDKLAEVFKTVYELNCELNKIDVLNNIKNYAPIIFGERENIEYFKNMPDDLSHYDVRDLNKRLQNEAGKYRIAAKKLECELNETPREGKGLAGLLQAAFDTVMNPDQKPYFRTDYRPNDGSIHNWLENKWIDLHNSIVKNWNS